MGISEKSVLDEHKYRRIPGMIVTSRGTILIYCEARYQGNDWSLMDVMAARSADGGETFGRPMILANGNDKHPAVNNPVAVEDKNGRIHLLYCEDYGINGGRILQLTSDDDGLTWSDPADITKFTAPHDRNVFAFGPGHGILSPDGTILLPVWMVPVKYGAEVNAHYPSVISTLYSADDGETWSLGEVLETANDVFMPNESEMAVTNDGEIYWNIRHWSRQRAVAYGKTGYSLWRDFRPDYSLNDPGCFGSVASYDDGVHPYTLFFANCDSKSARKNVTLRASFDGGRTWPKKTLIDAERGGYVECACDPARGKIYVLYESDWGERLHFSVVDYEEFMR